jgi:LysR family transcriptional regulator, nitrogen assimilation regulatory protein
LSQIRIDYPQIRMKVLEGFSGHVADWLSAGKVDLAVLYKTKSSALLDAEHLLFEDLYLISGAQAPVLGDGGAVSLAQIAPEELVLPGLPHGLRVLVDSASAQAQVPLNIAMELETLPTICDLAATGTIRTILPLTAVQAGLKAGTLVAQKIDSPPISRELILAHAPHRAAAPATKAVVRLIRSHIAELVRSGLWVGRI